MTTSVFYASDAFGLMQYFPDSHTEAINDSLPNTTTVQNVSAQGTGAEGAGTGDMNSGTLTNTPASGDLLIAVIMRADGQAVTAAPSGWANLTAGATAGSRSLEVWWARSTGVSGDKGPFYFDRASGTAAWCIELYSIGGPAACSDPSVATTSSAFASAATVTQTASMNNTAEGPGMVLTAFCVGGGTISSISGSFSGTGTQESHTTYSNGTYTRGGVSLVDLYNNADYSAGPTFGTAWSWTTSRAGHSCSIRLNAGGATYGTSVNRLSAGIGSTDASYANALCQSFVGFDTSSIPDSNTVSSATIKATGSTTAFGTGLGSVGFGDPANATLQFRYHGTSLPTNTRGNNNSTPYLTKTAFAAKTLAATFPAASTWSTSAENTLTSEAALPGLINKTGTTAFVISTDEYATGSAQSGAQAYAMRDAPTYTTLTVVHSFIGSATVAASLTVTPTISRAIAYARTVASSLAATPAIATVLSYGRTIASSITTSPTITNTTAYLRTITSDLTVTPTIVTARAFLRTIASTLTTTPTIIATYIPFTVQVARIVRLGGRSTIQLVQTVTARLGGRSTIRAPKE